MPGPQPIAIEALILALPETAGSALYGMVDVLAATGTLWRELVGEESRRRLIAPRIVSASREPFRCGNGIPVSPELAFSETPVPEMLIIPELWLAPTDDMRDRYPDLKDSPLLPRWQHDLHGLLRLNLGSGHRVAG